MSIRDIATHDERRIWKWKWQVLCPASGSQAHKQAHHNYSGTRTGNVTLTRALPFIACWVPSNKGRCGCGWRRWHCSTELQLGTPLDTRSHDIVAIASAIDSDSADTYRLQVSGLQSPQHACNV